MGHGHVGANCEGLLTFLSVFFNFVIGPQLLLTLFPFFSSVSARLTGWCTLGVPFTSLHDGCSEVNVCDVITEYTFNSVNSMWFWFPGLQAALRSPPICLPATDTQVFYADQFLSVPFESLVSWH